MENTAESSYSDNKINKIKNLFKKGEDSVKYSTQKDLILLLGLTGSGKSTFSQFIAGFDNNLRIVEYEDNTGTNVKPEEVDEDMGQLNIKKKYKLVDNGIGKIGNSLVDSNTTFPDLIIDTENNIALYDCPGFIDTRSAAHEIVGNYFVKKIIDSADRLKLLFVVDSTDISKDASNTIKLKALISHISRMVKNVNKFKDSIALILTKLDYQLTDEVYLKNVTIPFFKSLKEEMTESNKNNPEEWFQNGMDFIDILLEKKENVTGIFRQPNNPGKVATMQLLQKRKPKLRQIIFDNLKYTAVEENDFGYTLSGRTESQVKDLIENIIADIASDIQKIGQKIKQYYQSQEKKLKDIKNLHDMMRLGHDTFEVTRDLKIKEPQQLITDIRDNMTNLNVTISQTDIPLIENNIEYVTFLKKIVRTLTETQTSHLSWELNHLVEYLSDSQKWYSFLIDFHDSLSNYEVQKNIARFQEKKKVLKNNIVLNVAPSNQHKIFENITNIFNHDYGIVVPLDESKLEFLKNVLDLTIPNNVENSLCAKTSDTLLIQGENVKLSDIFKTECPDSKYIKIFALNKIFIDTDLKRAGDQVQLSIIAPTWEVIGTRKIILDGKPGKTLDKVEASPPVGIGINGNNGEPGNPGSDTGSFFGIGSSFINGENLSVSLKGGDGGPGQHGSNGTRGRDGELVDDLEKPVEFPDFETNCEELFKDPSPSPWQFLIKPGYAPLPIARDETYYICRYDGRACTNGGKGGKGGKGGEGGKAHEVLMFSLEKNQKPNINFHRVDGKNGTDGNPGAKKPDGRKGQFLQIDCTKTRTTGSNIDHTSYYYAKKGINYKKENHSHCVDANQIEHYPSTNHLHKPIKFDVFKPIAATNDYKSFIRQKLHDHMRETYLREFLELLETDKDLEKLNNPLGFVNELQGLEDQFYELHTKLPLLHFYESLLHRINKYIENIDNNRKLHVSDKKVLNYVYTATLSKIISIKNSNANKLILDLGAYLKRAMEDIKKLEHFINVQLIDDLNKNYHDSIEQQKDEALGFIDTKITSELTNILNQVNQELESLIDNAISQQAAAKKEKNELIEKEDAMRQQLATKSALGFLKMASKFLNFLGPVGSAAGVVISGGVQISEALVLDDSIDEITEDKFDKLPATVNSILPSIKVECKNKLESLKTQLELVQKQLKEEGPQNEEKGPKSNIIKEIDEQISNLQAEIAQQTDAELSYDSVIKKKQQLDEFVKQKREVVESEKSVSNIENVLLTLDRTETILGLVDMPVKFYSQLRKDVKKIDAVSLAIKKADIKLKSLEEYENNIYGKILPKCRFIENEVNNLRFKSKDQSRAALDISKWEIQNILGDIGDQVQKLTKEFTPQENVSHLMKKLEKSISAMINMYNLIQEYHDKQELAKYIANINSKKGLEIMMPDEESRLAVNNLKAIIQSNIVLEKFEKAMNSYRQVDYPFANYSQDNFTVPYAVQSNDTNDVISTTVDAMEYLKDKVDSDTLSISDMDHDIWINVTFAEAVDSDDPPFFIWTYDENKLAISKLLNGAEVTLKSDITRGLTKHNAVKFKSVGIFFKLANQTLQDNLNDQLKHFSISMTHLGHSQYKCDDKFHVITHENVIIKYKLGQNVGSTSGKINRVYGKLSKHEPMLSPYTMWKIQLIEKEGYPFDLLKKYQRERIDLVLEGTGNYVNPNPMIKNASVCNDDLNKYYKVDDTISPFNKKENSEIKSHITLPTSAQKQRKRRSLNEHERKRDVDEKLFTTSGAYSSMKSSFINNIFNAIGAGLVTIDYLNPVGKISQWFNKRGKSIDQDFNMLDNDEPLVLKFSNVVSPDTEMPEVSNMFINDESATINNAIYDSSICNHGNLLLLDLIIRSKSGVKHEQGNFMISKKMGSEYAQSLAYREHVPQ